MCLLKRTLTFYLNIFVICDAQFNDILSSIIYSGCGGIEDTVDFNDEYDFVVIGAGSGGSVVANRLTENPNWSVLLLEAGTEESFMSDIPLIGAFQSATRYNWGYRSEKMHTACLGLIEQKCHLARGKALGGTSVINFLLYTRGSKTDFDEWEILGNKGWSYKDVLPYFVKSENCSLCTEIDQVYHGINGFLNIEHPHFYTPIEKLFLKAGQEFGYKNVDINGRTSLGFTKVQATMKKGRRCSASKAFLHPISGRPNLDISMQSRATKISIDPKSRRTYGVEFYKNKVRHFLKVKKEVILSAGSFNSPQLLMLSGIGPKSDLVKLNIPVIQDLKVGYNLQDHLAMSTIAFLVNETVTISDFGVQNPAHMFNYLVNGEGPYTVPGGALAMAFVKTKYGRAKEDYPDIELVLGAGALNGDFLGSFRYLLGIPVSVFRKVYASLIGIPAFSIAPVLLRPKSRGRLMLKDSNPFHWPIIKPNYLQEEEDVATLVEGIKMAVQIAYSRPFERYATRINTIPFPGCENIPFGSDSYWACAVRHLATTLGHQVGTCKMGPPSDPDAVVDPELKVYGIKGLRIVDGSIMPNIIAGHTNAVIFMIGEKASDLIKNTWKDY